jgi:hypothetical protein
MWNLQGAPFINSKTKGEIFVQQLWQNFRSVIRGLEPTSMVGSISDLKPKGLGLESLIRQGYICWWRGSKRSGCVMNASPCGFKVKEFALKFPKNLITNFFSIDFWSQEIKSDAVLNFFEAISRQFAETTISQKAYF